MKQVKARLYQAQSYYHKWRNEDNSQMEEEGAKPDNETGRVKQLPGVIVKVTFDEPMSCVTTFKVSCIKPGMSFDYKKSVHREKKTMGVPLASTT